jgi:hypothetical protein
VSATNQAGASGRGRTFPAQHAECVFIAAPTKPVARHYVTDLRKRAAAHGRDLNGLLVYAPVTVILGETDAAAQAKFEEYRSYASYDGALVFFSGWTEIDLGQYAPTDLVRKVETSAVISPVEALAEGDLDMQWTIDELAAWGGIGGVGPVFVESPATVADGSRTSSNCWCRSCSGAVSIRRHIAPARCGKSCSVAAHICPTIIRARGIATCRALERRPRSRTRRRRLRGGLHARVCRSRSCAARKLA